MLYEIRHRYNSSVLFSLECDSMRLCVEAAVAQRVSLSFANLSAADLSAADLQPIIDDFYAVLSYAPAEVPALIAALEAGRVNGSTYTDGECGCLVGTLAIAAGADPHSALDCEVVHDLNANSRRPAERFFLSILKGSTPENNQFAKLAHEWATAWLGRMQAAFVAQEARVQIFTTATAYWDFNKIKFGSKTGLVANRASNAILGYTVNGKWSGVEDDTLGYISYFNGSDYETAVFGTNPS